MNPYARSGGLTDRTQNTKRTTDRPNQGFHPDLHEQNRVRSFERLGLLPAVFMVLICYSSLGMLRRCRRLPGRGLEIYLGLSFASTLVSQPRGRFL